jgi:hypothetical protein
MGTVDGLRAGHAPRISHVFKFPRTSFSLENKVPCTEHAQPALMPVGKKAC